MKRWRFLVWPIIVLFSILFLVLFFQPLIEVGFLPWQIFGIAQEPNLGPDQKIALYSQAGTFAAALAAILAVILPLVISEESAPKQPETPSGPTGQPPKPTSLEKLIAREEQKYRTWLWNAIAEFHPEGMGHPQSFYIPEKVLKVNVRNSFTTHSITEPVIVPQAIAEPAIVNSLEVHSATAPSAIPETHSAPKLSASAESTLENQRVTLSDYFKAQGRFLKDFLDPSSPPPGDTHPRYLLVGEVGTGKTYSLKHYALELAGPPAQKKGFLFFLRRSSTLARPSTSKKLPIYIQLPEFLKSALPGTELHLLTFII
jgi:hypothetical protein